MSSTKEKADILHKNKIGKKELAEMYSLWADCMYKLSIGNHVCLIIKLYLNC